MKTIEWKYPKEVYAKIPPGPWKDLPFDKRQWLDPATNLPIIARRNRFAVWCGYVAVPSSHLLYGMMHDDSRLLLLSPYFNVNYSSKCDPDAGEFDICHIVEPGEEDDVWWFGFDYGHAGDYCPGYMTSDEKEMFGLRWHTYEECAASCSQLALQLCSIK